jgi:hypothetical protein
MDLSLILEELRALRCEVQALHLVQNIPTDVPKCKGVTGKGTDCRNKAVEGSEYCRMHGERGERPVRVVKVRKVGKLKKIQPEHVHVEGGVCMLCETHGNVMDPGLPYCGFEGCDVVT